MTQNSETMAGWLLACRTESGMDYRTVIYCRESDLMGYTELIGYRLATAAEMDQAAEADLWVTLLTSAIKNFILKEDE